VIVIDKLTVQFGGVKPINELCAELSAPIAGLIGPNGAGKTTLLNVLSGFVQPKEGSVTVCDASLLALKPLQRVYFGLRRSFQTEQVVGDLSVVDNLAALADHVLPLSIKARQRSVHIQEALAFVGLQSCANTLGADLNLYQRRLVELGKCVVGQPRLILLDEPAAGLTDEESAALRDVVLRIPKQYQAQVLVIDHDVELIRALCSQTLVLDYGRKLALGPTDEVLAEPAVRRAYLGEME